MKKISIFISLLLIVYLSGCTELRRAKVLLPYSWVGMKKVSSTLYVENNMSKENQQKIEDTIPEAKEYVKEIYGEVTTEPIIYACQTKECANSLGLMGKEIGVRLLGHIILSHRAFDKTLGRGLIAHEWSHEELYNRIGGFWHWYREIPIWFDEGLATLTMQKISRYDERAWQRIMDEKISYPKQDELVSSSQWSKACQSYLIDESIVVPYATSRKIVSKWYKKAGQKGLVELLDGIKKGKDFNELYKDKR